MRPCACSICGSVAELPTASRCLRCRSDDAADVEVRVAIDEALGVLVVGARVRAAFARGDRAEHRRLLSLLRHALRVVDDVGGLDL